ncbi:hypothetical protein [Nonomuraea basaltis]|uniref:hypothetical protein n=1 Tax=Nonomuraea basaltis TaxID=2495887 RepID=UPI0014864543|nr:hypothetical protein [Nonomuraea basaltis]
MAIVELYFAPEEPSFLPAAGYPQYLNTPGSTFGLTGLAYDGVGASVEEAAWKFNPAKYGSGAITVDIIWYGLGATSGAVVWGAGLAAITPNTDTQDPTTKTFAASGSVTTSHLGTTAKRLHKSTITLSGASLDSIAAGDEAWLRVFRTPGAAGDTLAADAVVTSVRLSYSDT